MNENTPISPNPLREERLQRGWSQQELANRLGTTVVTIKRWERANQQPSAYFRVRLCTLFGKSAEELGLCKDREPSERATAVTPQQEDNLLLTLASAPSSIILTQEHAEEQRSKDDLPPKRALTSIPSPLYHTLSLLPKYAYSTARNKKGLLSIVMLLLLIGVSTLFFVNPSVLSWSNFRNLPVTHIRSALPRRTDQSARSPLGVGGLAGTLSLDDDLEHQDPQSSWEVGDECTFQDKGYHVRFVGINYCLANDPSFSDFAYQIDVELQQGNQAGVVFRANGDSHLYYFYVDTHGHYGLDMVNPPQSHQTLISGTSRVINQGYNRFNILTVTARGSVITLWINQQQVGQVQDATFSEGHVGVAAGNYGDASQTSIIAALFRHARVWEQLSQILSQHEIESVTTSF